MTINLLDMAKGYFTDAVISRLSGSLTENPEDIQKALTGALPLVLGGVVNQYDRPDGPGTLTTLIQQVTGTSTATGTTTALTDADDPDVLMRKGGGLIESIFGSNSGPISNALAQFSGVKSGSAQGIMGIAGALIMGLLGRHLMAQGGGVGTDSLGSLLGSQRESVGAAMPSGLGSLLGTTSGMELPGGLVGGATPGPRPAAPVTEPVADRPGKKQLWTWLLPLLAGVLLYLLFRSCGNNADTTVINTDDTTSATITDATATLDSASTRASTVVDSAAADLDEAGKAVVDAATALGTFGTRKLRDGIELTIPANGIENRLLSFIEDEAKLVDETTWFDFDRLTFETGSAKLKPESREQLQNMAAILKAYPAVKLKIGGYTDKTGNAAAHKKLAQQRADAALYELVRLGVAKDRLEAEGYGPEHPIAPNTTEAGQQKNRRIAVRVTSK